MSAAEQLSPKRATALVEGQSNDSGDFVVEQVFSCPGSAISKEALVVDRTEPSSPAALNEGGSPLRGCEC